LVEKVRDIERRRRIGDRGREFAGQHRDGSASSRVAARTKICY
jgi:hypothetical protein